VQLGKLLRDAEAKAKAKAKPEARVQRLVGFVFDLIKALEDMAEFLAVHSATSVADTHQQFVMRRIDTRR
jgi:hypothetical protein